MASPYSPSTTRAPFGFWSVDRSPLMANKKMVQKSCFIDLLVQGEAGIYQLAPHLQSSIHIDDLDIGQVPFEQVRGRHGVNTSAANDKH